MRNGARATTGGCGTANSRLGKTQRGERRHPARTGLYAADRLPLERLRAGTSAIAAMRYAKPNRVVHTSDDSELKMGEYFDVVADDYSLPHPPRLPRVEVERSVSPALWSFMNESRRLSNVRMKRELKVKLRYPMVADLLAGMKDS